MCPVCQWAFPTGSPEVSGSPGAPHLQWGQGRPSPVGGSHRGAPQQCPHLGDLPHLHGAAPQCCPCFLLSPWCLLADRGLQPQPLPHCPAGVLGAWRQTGSVTHRRKLIYGSWAFADDLGSSVGTSQSFWNRTGFDILPSGDLGVRRGSRTLLECADHWPLSLWPWRQTAGQSTDVRLSCRGVKFHPLTHGSKVSAGRMCGHGACAVRTHP